VLAILLIIYIFNFADRYLITGLVGPIKTEFDVGDGTMGLLMGPAFVLLYVVLGVPFARLADRGSRVKIIALGCIFWSAATVATGFASSIEELALARIAVGIGEAAFVAPAYSLLTDYFRLERRGIAFAILGLATYFGQIAGQAVGPALAAAFENWRMAFILMGSPGIFLGILALLLISEPGRGDEATDNTTPTVSFGALLGLLLGNRAYILMAIGFALGALSGVSFAYWAPELLTRTHGLNPVTVKSSFAFFFGLSGLCGMLAFGFLSDRLAPRGTNWPTRLSAIALAAATLSILSVVWAGSFSVAMALAIPCGLLGGGWTVGIFSTLQYMLPASIRASSTALFIAFITLAGYFVGPWLTGSLSEAFGDSARSLQIALSIVIPLGIVGALSTWLASRHVELGRAQLANI
jgi:MFS family permease